jgi:hypothetical protein
LPILPKPKGRPGERRNGRSSTHPAADLPGFVFRSVEGLRPPISIIHLPSHGQGPCAAPAPTTLPSSSPDLLLLRCGIYSYFVPVAASASEGSTTATAYRSLPHCNLHGKMIHFARGTERPQPPVWLRDACPVQVLGPTSTSYPHAFFLLHSTSSPRSKLCQLPTPAFNPAEAPP